MVCAKYIPLAVRLTKSPEDLVEMIKQITECELNSNEVAVLLILVAFQACMTCDTKQ